MSYTNSPLVTDVLLSSKHSIRRHSIDTVTVHCFVGQVTAREGLEFFKRTTRDASTNYVVGRDGSIGLCVEEKYRAWTSGGSLKANGMTGSENDHRAVTIEVASDTARPYKVTDAAMDALIRLLADICQRNGIEELRWKADKNLVGVVNQQNMSVHRWFDPRECPGDYLFNRHGQIAAAVNKILQEEDDDNTMTQEQFNGMMNVYLSELKKQPAQPYAQDALAWAAKQGLMVGDGNGNQQPMMFLAREDEVLIEYRAEKRIADAIRKALKDLGL